MNVETGWSYGQRSSVHYLAFKSPGRLSKILTLCFRWRRWLPVASTAWLIHGKWHIKLGSIFIEGVRFVRRRDGKAGIWFFCFHSSGDSVVLLEWKLFTVKVQICCSLTCLISAVIPVGGFTSLFAALVSPSVKREMSHNIMWFMILTQNNVQYWWIVWLFFISLPFPKSL